MFDDAEVQLQRILQLVEKCPAKLQEKAFEVLLQGYVQSQMPSGPDDETRQNENDPGSREKPRLDAQTAAEIPEEIRARFSSTAKRIGIADRQFATLFDFSTDPFRYHALVVPGSSKAEKTRNVALLVAAKNYLVTGQWTGDWKEFRAMCVDQNCYDRANNPTYVKHDYFKSATPDNGVTLSGSGERAAQELLATLSKSEKPEE